jgi:hypothetical protein
MEAEGFSVLFITNQCISWVALKMLAIESSSKILFVTGRTAVPDVHGGHSCYWSGCASDVGRSHSHRPHPSAGVYRGLGICFERRLRRRCGSMKFWCGSGSEAGSVDPYLCLMDPDADVNHAISSVTQDKKIFSYCFCLIMEGSRYLTNGSRYLTNGS